MSAGEEETKRIFCNTCKGPTNHLLRARNSLAEKIYQDDDEDDFGIHEHRCSLWSCAGCTAPTLEWQMGYENPTFDGGLEELVLSYFPAREQDSINRKLFTSLKPELALLYGEVIACFNNDCLLLCTIGLRALIEGVCVDKGLTAGNLEHQIDGLIKFLPSVNLIEALHAFRFAGNDAAHRLEALPRDEAKMAIEVMEDLLNFLYDLDYKASRMQNASRRTALKSTKPGSVQ